MKTCSKCQLAKPASEYHKRAKSADGLQGRCKDCARAAHVQRWADPAKRERMLRASSEWYQRNREASRERHEGYRRKAGVPPARRLDPNATEKECPRCGVVLPIDAFGSATRAADGRATYCRDCVAVLSRRDYERHRDRRIASVRAYEAKNPEAVARMMVAVHSRRRARLLGATVEGAPVTVESIAARWAMWGDRCYLCGGEATETDHVIPLARGGKHVPANLRPACRSCNASKNARPLAAIAS